MTVSAHSNAEYPIAMPVTASVATMRSAGSGSSVSTAQSIATLKLSVSVRALGRFDLVSAAQSGSCSLRNHDVVGGMTGPYGSCSAACVQVLLRVLADRFEHAIAHTTVIIGHCDDERLVDQLCDDVDDVQRIERVVTEHHLGGGEVGTTGEHRERLQGATLGVVEEVVGPVDGVPQRLVTLDRRATPTRQQFEALVQAGDEILRCQRCRTSRGELIASGMPSRRRHSTPTVSSTGAVGSNRA